MGSKVSTLLQPEEVAAIQNETGCWFSNTTFKFIRILLYLFNEFQFIEVSLPYS